jgi:hypothetical protein
MQPAVNETLLQQLLQQQQQQQQQASQPLAASGISSSAEASREGGSSLASLAAASSAAGAAADGAKLFNPFGMSFIDPTAMVEPRKAAQAKQQEPNAQPQQQQRQPQQEGQEQQAPQQNKLQQLSEQQQQEIMAMLMPELAAMGMSPEQQLQVLKRMLGQKQKQTEEQQQQAQTPAQPSAAAAAAAAPPQPQHVWLQQLAAGKSAAADLAAKPGSSSTAAAEAASQPGASSSGSSGAQQDQQQDASSAVPAAPAEPASDVDEFDPSMLPADLFDFLDGNSSPTGQQGLGLQGLGLQDSDEGLGFASSGAAGTGSASPNPWGPSSDAQRSNEDAQQLDGSGNGRLGKYVPPSLRRTSAENNSSKPSGLQARTSSGSGNPNNVTSPLASAASLHHQSSGAYQHPHARDPHARERSGSPPPGFGRGTNAGPWRRSSADVSHAVSEQEQRILAQQQLLPPHLRIVHGDGGPRSSSGGDDYMWPPPPPPPPPPQPQPQQQTQHEGEDAGRSKIRRLLEQAAAKQAAPVPPPPPPPPTHRPHALEHASSSASAAAGEHGDGYGGPQGRSRVPPGFEPGSAAAGAGQFDDWGEQQPGNGGEHGWGERGAAQAARDSWSAAEQQRGRPLERWNSGAEGSDGSSRGMARPRSDYEVGYEHSHDSWSAAAEEEPRFAPHYGARGVGRGAAVLQRRRGYSPPGRTAGARDDDWSGPGSHPAAGEEFDRGVDRGFDRGFGRGEAGWQRGRGRSMPAGRDAHAHEHAAAAAAPGSSRGPGGYEEDWQEVEEDRGRLSSRYAAGSAGARQPRRPSSREVEAGEGGPGMTWQQQQLLAEEHVVPAGPAAQAAERHRERSPADSSRRMTAVPQPSQHLRAAAHHPARGRSVERDAAAAEPGPHGSSHASEFLRQLGGRSRSQREQQEEWAGAADDSSSWPSPGESLPAKQLAAREAAASAAAAALAAVQGLKPFCTVAPPRTAKPVPARKGSSPMAPQPTLHSQQSLNSPQALHMQKGSQLVPARSGSGQLQMPSVEETQAAVMAALGAAPAGPSRSSSLASSNYIEQPAQQDTGSFWRAGSSSVDRVDRPDGGGAAAGGFDSREREIRDAAELAREGSGGSGQQQGVFDAAGGSGARRGGSSLFSNVIGQLRKQATTTRSDSGRDAEGMCRFGNL